MQTSTDNPDTPRQHRVIIIGAGLGGLATAARLKMHGHSDLVILDRGSSVGGVWRANTYPNAACDTPVELYSFTFFKKSNWSSNFAPWNEILGYAEDLARSFDLEKHLELNTEIASAHWDDDVQQWHVRSVDGRAWIAEFLVWAGGLFSQPLIPDFPGMSTYRGTVIHTARWDSKVDLTKRTVAVVGAGASSIQVIPYAAEHAKQLYAFIRTPSHVLPKPEVHYAPEDWQRFSSDPASQAELRQKWTEHFEKLAASRFPMNDALISEQETMWRDFINREVVDADLRELLTPRYRFGCRRPLVSNAYYKSLTAPHVRVFATGIKDLDETGVVTSDGEHLDVDVVILATGFRTAGMLGNLDIRGRAETSLQQQWGDVPQAYLGMLVQGFPNFFMIIGPNALTASVSSIVEAQSEYIAACIDLVRSKGVGSVEVPTEVQDEFNKDVRQRSNASVMVQGGCESYYRSGGNGTVFTHWPGTSRSYQEAVAQVRSQDLVWRGRPAKANDVHDEAQVETKC